jgi:SAM-dependent methyltransferase
MSAPDDYRSRLYQDYAASVDPALRGASLPALDANDAVFSRDFAPFLPSDTSARILDAGCGRGNLLSFLKRAGYTNAVGVDRSPASVAAARAAGLNAEEGDALDYMNAHPGGFDAVVAVDVLEHLRKDEVLQFLDAAFKALKAGGVFVAQTANAEALFASRMLNIDFTHETAFTRHSLRQVLVAAGFTDAEFKEIAPVGTGPRACLRRVLWTLIRLKLSALLHAETGSGILHNDHIFSQIFLAKARKPV